MSLAKINLEYENIIHSNGISDDERTRKLAELMSRMEKEFKIPMIEDLEFEKENKKVMAMYNKISNSRSFG